MPPITLAFIKDDHSQLKTTSDFEKFIRKEISNGFILDGIQRLSTLRRAFDEGVDNEFPLDQSLFINVLICTSMDNLLYRMITLNNGQKPMTTRHQIEILSSNLFNFDSEEIEVLKEKDGTRRAPGLFSQSDFVLGYMAYLSSTTNVDSQKLIQDKLDDLLASKILEHDPTKDTTQFSDVIQLIAKLIKSKDIDHWFKNNNNLIGFCSSVRTCHDFILRMSPAKFENFVKNFEEAFKSFNVSKLKVGRDRRNAVSYAIKNIRKISNYTADEIMDKLVEVLE